jgi:hypothetical protein
MRADSSFVFGAPQNDADSSESVRSRSEALRQHWMLKHRHATFELANAIFARVTFRQDAFYWCVYSTTQHWHGGGVAASMDDAIEAAYKVIGSVIMRITAGWSHIADSVNAATSLPVHDAEKSANTSKKDSPCS